MLQKKNAININKLIQEVESNPNIQGHICICHNDFFDISMSKKLYGFPSRGTPNVYNFKISAWRAISSLYNIGPEDLIFFYRRKGDNPGAQEFHGVFKISEYDDMLLRLFHYKDEDYMPRLPKVNKFVPFRFIFKPLVTNPISIPNDFLHRHNLEIIKSLSETDPDKPKLWGFRNPPVMNIGAARKSSIVAISNKQTRLLLEMLSSGVERPTPSISTKLKTYDLSSPPSNFHLLNHEFLARHFFQYVARSEAKIDYEAELYAYIIGSLKNSGSPCHKKILDDFTNVNDDLNIPFEEIAKNVILETILTTHIQEEIDILLCDQDEKNFLILEVKGEEVNEDHVAQTEKYVELTEHIFPNNESVRANVIGLRNVNLKNTSETVKVVYYEIEKIGENMAGINFVPSNE